MTSSWCTEFLLFLFFHCVYSEKPEPTFRIHGNNIEMGYCFGVDYIVVYRSAPEGDQLLGNSSDNITPITPPADLQGRIYINKQPLLLGLQILNLTNMDSAIYRRECWQNQTVVTQLTQHLFVCNEELGSQEIIVKEEDAETEILCNSTSVGLEGTFVRWYREMYPVYKLTLILDSSVSLEPLVEDLQSLVKVRDKGALLVLNKSVLNNNQQFYCLVFKGKDCLSMQNIYLPDDSESRQVFASQGERMVLNCPSKGYNQHWETPLGKITDSVTTQNQMHIKSEDKDFLLVIPSVSIEHNGEYSCISSLLEVQYSLVFCPLKTTLHERVFEGNNILLECGVGQDNQTVKWYRQKKLETTERIMEIIYDSSDNTVPIPEDLKDRLTLSNRGFSLTISNLQLRDERIYSCVVLRDHVFPDYDIGDYNDYNLEDTEDIEDTEDTEDTGDTEDYEFVDDQAWNYSLRCILKQETILTFERIPRTTTPIDNSQVPFKVYAVVAGLVALVLCVGVIVAVIALRRKAKAASHCEQTVRNDINMREDPSCTKKLTDDDDEL